MDPLAGVRVLDLTQVIAGPVATMHLGDYGAEVLKVEHPDGGDVYREFEPAVGGVGAQWASLNRNKRSVTLDLSTDAGREAFYDLAETADVLVENFKRGSTAKLGIEYETVAEICPDIVYCSIRGFASDSDYADYPAFDMIVQAMSGAMSITGQADGPPTWSGVPMGDLAPGSYAAEAILAALFGRAVGDDGGRHIEIPMFDALASWLGPRATQSLVEGAALRRTGNVHPNAVPYKVFETADSAVAVCVVGDLIWPDCCAAVDRPDLEADDRFATAAARAENRDALYGILDGIIASASTEAWLERFRDHGVPCAPVHDTFSVWQDPYAESEDLVEELRPDGAEEPIPVVRNPVRVDDEQLDARRAPRRLGADTEAVLREVGYSDADVERLRDADAI
jgi:crotonobetainyl-CoA:carnitine CoA-transferase CaiB-like acyl-CoA transferase